VLPFKRRSERSKSPRNSVSDTSLKAALVAAFLFGLAHTALSQILTGWNDCILMRDPSRMPTITLTDLELAEVIRGLRISAVKSREDAANCGSMSVKRTHENGAEFNDRLVERLKRYEPPPPPERKARR
jgi:hypothetical protein